MNTKDFVEYAIKAQRKFSDLYNDESLGLIAIGETGIQVTEQEFKRIIDSYSVLYKVSTFSLDIFPLIATTTIEGVEIYTIGTKQEFQDVGLEW